MTVQVQLLSRSEVAQNTLAVELVKPTEFSFSPGQSIDLAIENPNWPDEQGSVRSLSIASAPHEPNLLVAFRLRNSAFKQELSSLPLGADNLSIDGPFDGMALAGRSDRPVVMLAGGIGVTPFRSMVLDAVYRDLPCRITLFYSFRDLSDAAFLEELSEVASKYPRFSLIPVVTGAGEVPAGAESGRVGVEMLQRHLSGASRPVFYLAGSADFVQGTQGALEELGVGENDVRFEEFPGY